MNKHLPRQRENKQYLMDKCRFSTPSQNREKKGKERTNLQQIHY